MAKDKSSGGGSGDVFNELVTQWERSFDAFANQFMGTEGFSQAMNATQSAQLGLQKLVAETMGRQLSTMNMPTREDVLRLGEAMQDIARRLDRIEERLGAQDNTPKSPPRTKRPPSEAGE